MGDKLDKVLDTVAIKSYLPHRFPFLMVDRILEHREDYAKALKNVTNNEDHFVGHFPNSPVMPGVLILEALAQTACFMPYDENIKRADLRELEVFFMGIEKARFRKVVVPGDQLILETKLSKRRGEYWWIDAKAYVDGVVVCEASMSAVMK